MTVKNQMDNETQEVRDNSYYKGKSITVIIAEAIVILIRISEKLFKMSPAIFNVMTRKVEKTQIGIFTNGYSFFFGGGGVSYFGQIFEDDSKIYHLEFQSEMLISSANGT